MIFYVKNISFSVMGEWKTATTMYNKVKKKT